MTTLTFGGDSGEIAVLPNWVPAAVRHYIAHTEQGVSIRALARGAGCAASTVLRQIRRLETRRDDPLFDAAISRLADLPDCTSEEQSEHSETHLEAEARRILRRLIQPQTTLAVSQEMPQAVVLRIENGEPKRLAVLERGVAEVFLVKNWIERTRAGRVSQYEVSHAGRKALRRILTHHDTPEIAETRGQSSCVEAAEAPATFHAKVAESPLTALARRRDRDGSPFLNAEMVRAGERLREDFELAQMAEPTAPNWDRFLTGTDDEGFRMGAGSRIGTQAAQSRVQSAIKVLGPGLGDVALRCCCHLEGLEMAEKRLGWSARSGKIVLRIALQRLARHYEHVHSQGGDLIG